MIVTIHQPEHLPWLGFFHKMAQADLYVVMDQVQYRHHYFQNRNQILGAAGPIRVNVPVLKTQHLYGAIMDVAIDNRQPWRKTYWKSIAYHYGKHPHFARYADALQAIIMGDQESLYELNMALIGFFREVLAIETPMIRASSLQATGGKTELLHAICHELGATCYLSGPSGRDYLDPAPFQASGIAVRYHDFVHPTYPQRGRATFTPFLSALDLILNAGPESRRYLLEDALAAV